MNEKIEQVCDEIRDQGYWCEIIDQYKTALYNGSMKTNPPAKYKTDYVVLVSNRNERTIKVKITQDLLVAQDVETIVNDIIDHFTKTA